MKPKDIFRTLNHTLFLTYMILIVTLPLCFGTQYWYKPNTHWAYFESHVAIPNYYHTKNLTAFLILTKSLFPTKVQEKSWTPPSQQETHGIQMSNMCGTLVPKRNITNVLSIILSNTMNFSLPIMINNLPNIVAFSLYATQPAFSKHQKT